MRLTPGVLVTVLLLLMVSAATAHAETWVSFGGISHHFSDGNYNEKNVGLGLERGLNEDWRFMAGRYKNSHDLYTNYAGFGYTPFSIGPVKLGAVAGGFTGYGKKVLFVPMGAAMIEGKRLGLNVLYVPSYKDSEGLVIFQFKVKW